VLEAFTSEISLAFSGLSPTAKAKFLAHVAWMETIHVRAAYFDDPSDTEALYRSSEFVHRLSSCIIHVLSNDTDASYATFVASMIAEGTDERGEQARARILSWLAH
jgi:hypothetical protein